MTLPTFNEERSLWKKDYSFISGIDEVGRGSFAGPLVTAAVIFPKNYNNRHGINDSKLLTPKQREEQSNIIKQVAMCFSISTISVSVINKVGIEKATQMGFRKSIKELSVMPDYVLIDAFKIKQFANTKQKAIIKGDRISVSIAAASIIAKVYRDSLMNTLHEKLPQYDFQNNKGYGTNFHRKAIYELGLTKWHRTSFNLSKYINTKA